MANPPRQATKVVANDEECEPDLVASDGFSSDGFSSDGAANRVSVRDLKTHLSAWLGRVQAGEVVEVTSHRKAIARITGVKTQEQASTSPLQEAPTAGLISWSGQKPTLPPPVRLRRKGKRLSEIVIDDRG
jgi:prevent-host-death family protein